MTPMRTKPMTLVLVALLWTAALAIVPLFVRRRRLQVILVWLLRWVAASRRGLRRITSSRRSPRGHR